MRANEAETGMPRNRKDDPGQVGARGPNAEAAMDKETFGEALSRAGFKPAKVERRLLSQGRRRETLKKRESGDPD